MPRLAAKYKPRNQFGRANAASQLQFCRAALEITVLAHWLYCLVFLRVISTTYGE